MSFYLDPIFDFEKALAKYTGAPYAIVTDSCTHALELCFIYSNVKECQFTAYTYIGILMLMHKLNIKYSLTDERWSGEFRFHKTNIFDSARKLQKNMYISGQFQCLSFGTTKPLEIGRVGAILTDNKDAYEKLSMMRSDGRNLRDESWQKSQFIDSVEYQSKLTWGNQRHFNIGYHYCPTISDCKRGLELLKNFKSSSQTVAYSDCRLIHISNAS